MPASDVCAAFAFPLGDGVIMLDEGLLGYTLSIVRFHHLPPLTSLLLSPSLSEESVYPYSFHDFAMLLRLLGLADLRRSSDSGDSDHLGKQSFLLCTSTLFFHNAITAVLYGCELVFRALHCRR